MCVQPFPVSVPIALVDLPEQERESELSRPLPLETLLRPPLKLVDLLPNWNLATNCPRALLGRTNSLKRIINSKLIKPNLTLPNPN